MTNREKYAEQILDIACGGNALGVKNGKPIACGKVDCTKCDICADNREVKVNEWANSEYVEPPVNWSKVPVDTPILVKHREDEKWRKRYFATYEDGIVYAWGAGGTSWSADGIRCNWKYAKLAESEE